MSRSADITPTSPSNPERQGLQDILGGIITLPVPISHYDRIILANGEVVEVQSSVGKPALKPGMYITLSHTVNFAVSGESVEIQWFHLVNHELLIQVVNDLGSRTITLSDVSGVD